MENDVEVVPSDWVAFVTTHAGRLTRACHELTGNERVAESLRLDLLAIVALRWHRWWRPSRRRPESALRQLDDLLKREVRTYELVPGRAEPPPLVKSIATSTVDADAVDDADVSERAEVAAAAWRRARQLRRQSAINLAAAAVALALLAALGPGVRPPPPTPAPPPLAELPVGVTLLPRYDQLSQYALGSSRLPTQPDASPNARTLAEAPVTHAVAVYQVAGGPLVVVDSGGPSRVEASTLAGARLLTTSLSPAGNRVVLAAADSLVALDLATASVRTFPVTAPLRIMTWRTDHSVIIAAPDSAHEVDLDTGTVTRLAGLTGIDVVSNAGPQLTELVTLTTTSVQTPRIRFWRKDPGQVPVDVEDRPVFGPQWIAAWQGPSWASPVLYVRACDADAVIIPDRFGKPTAAVAAVQPNGIHAGTLVSVDAVRIDVLGFVEANVALVAAYYANARPLLLSWNPGTRRFERVGALPAGTDISVANLLVS